MLNEGVDYFEVNATKGQRISVEIEAFAFGSLFDPYVALLDDKRFELATSDDSELLCKTAPAGVSPEDGV